MFYTAYALFLRWDLFRKLNIDEQVPPRHPPTLWRQVIRPSSRPFDDVGGSKAHGGGGVPPGGGAPPHGQVAINFFSQVEAGYHPNPYHNAMHGADVMHILHYLLGRLLL